MRRRKKSKQGKEASKSKSLSEEITTEESPSNESQSVDWTIDKEVIDSTVRLALSTEEFLAEINCRIYEAYIFTS